LRAARCREKRRGKKRQRQAASACQDVEGLRQTLSLEEDKAAAEFRLPSPAVIDVPEPATINSARWLISIESLPSTARPLKARLTSTACPG